MVNLLSIELLKTVVSENIDMSFLLEKMHIKLSGQRQSSCSWRTDVIYGHHNDIMMSVMASQIISLTIVYWTIYSGADERKHRSSALLAFVR